MCLKLLFIVKLCKIVENVNRNERAFSSIKEKWNIMRSELCVLSAPLFYPIPFA